MVTLTTNEFGYGRHLNTELKSVTYKVPTECLVIII